MKLVLLPGLDGTGCLYEPLTRILPPEFSHLVLPYPKDKPLSYAELVELVQRRLQDEKEYVLVAESFSGPVAIEIAATLPANLKALVLCATFISNPSTVPQSVRALLRGPFFRLEPPQFFIERYFLGPKPFRHLVESFRYARHSVPAEVLAFRMRSVLNVDVRRAFAACRVPILYLLGKQDRLVRRRSVDEMLKIQPDMRVAEIDGPHLLLQREPDKCFEAIDRFLDAVL